MAAFNEKDDMVARAKKPGIEVIEVHQRLSARGNHLLTITASRLHGKKSSSNRRKKWAQSYSNVL